MSNNNPIGSTWKKWDLHIHTPSSVVHNYPGTDDEAWEAFLLDLEALSPEFKVSRISIEAPLALAAIRECEDNEK